MTNQTTISAAAPVAAAVPRRDVGLWLLVCCAMVFAMVVLGGATRLTESGLSMVNWRPLTGILPPLGADEWQAAFARYRESPEFQKLNFWMTLADFKTIFWLEFIHRLWGRLIGVVFLVPFLWFLVRGRIDAALGVRLGAVFALGAAQGGLGWYMVESGLVDRPEVSQYRLAAHLALAFLIYGLMLWIALGCLSPRRRARAGALAGHTVLLIGWIAVTVVAGAFVAGLDAGLAYNTFPLMAGRLVPPGLFDLSPWPVNFFENTTTVQFTHRLLGTTLAILALWLGWRAWAAPIPRRARRVLALVAAMAVIQMGLGIATLLSVVALPLAVLHQGGAMVLFTLALWALYELPMPGDSGVAASRRPNGTAPAR